MVKKRIKHTILILASLLLCLVLVFGMSASIMKVFAAEASNNSEVLYLSDTSRITHDKSSFSLGNSRLWMAPSQKDNIPNKVVQAKIEGAWYTFEYGVYAHASSLVVFDISKFSDKYKYFSAYAGLCNGASKSNGVLVRVDFSQDGKNWTTDPEGKTPVTTNEAGSQFVGYNQNFIHFTYDVTGVKWIRLFANKNGSDAADQVLWTDAKLTTSLDEGEEVPPISVLDSKIKEEVTKGKDIADPTLELLVLQRELISRVGQYALKRFLVESEDNKAMWNWLFYDLASLREFMMGGTPFKGNYFNSLTVLSGLYKRYKKDLTVKDKLKNNTITPDRTFGELCRTMMFSVALTHDGPIGSYLQGSKPQNASDPYRRYAIFKYMYQTERFVALRNADGSWKSETMTMFGNMEVEEMRWLMCNIIDDESIIWLNDYVQTRINNAKNVGSLYTPHSYVRYTDPNYGIPVFYAEENQDYLN
ncbi:MAG: NPCBM/NEW2 domain-containing protein, partial [Clostridia bacterium]|nr:NPCBM/NEW2 domain-containing protein [Clostridia bacterium]